MTFVKMCFSILVLLCVGILTVSNKAQGAEPRKNCKPHGLVKYNLTFEGHWSEDDFPKQYPLFRPNAQWSKLIGRSHSSDYTLFKMGSTASIFLKEFCEFGTTTKYDEHEQQGRRGILDVFYTTPLKFGVGVEWVTFFADEHHHLLSVASKIIPSPDWFVGINSINLCDDNDWLTETEVNLFPIDAGTDKGFTFTSPNWAETPLRPITQITSTFPSHQANSFYYPKLSHLPVMAKVRIHKLGVFENAEEVKEVTKYDEDSVSYHHVIENELLGDKYVPVTEKEPESPQEVVFGVDILNGNEIILDETAPELTTEDVGVVTKERDYGGKSIIPKAGKINSQIKTTKGFSNTEITLDTSKLLRHTTQSAPKELESTSEELVAKTEQSEYDSAQATAEDVTSKHATEIISTTGTSTDIPLNDFIQKHILPRRKDQRHRRKNKRNHKHNGRHEKEHGLNNPEHSEPKPEKVNCVLGEWGEWSACSVTCGYGRRNRVRVVVQQPKHGGVPCRQYPEEDLCGSLRTCSQWKHFSFANWGIHLK